MRNEYTLAHVASVGNGVGLRGLVIFFIEKRNQENPDESEDDHDRENGQNFEEVFVYHGNIIPLIIKNHEHIIFQGVASADEPTRLPAGRALQGIY